MNSDTDSALKSDFPKVVREHIKGPSYLPVSYTDLSDSSRQHHRRPLLRTKTPPPPLWPRTRNLPNRRILPQQRTEHKIPRSNPIRHRQHPSRKQLLCQTNPKTRRNNPLFGAPDAHAKGHLRIQAPPSNPHQYFESSELSAFTEALAYASGT